MLSNLQIYDNILREIDLALGEIGLIKASPKLDTEMAFYIDQADKLTDLLLSYTDKAQKKAINQFITFLKAGSGNISIEEFGDALGLMEEILGDPLGKALEDPINSYVAETYQGAQKAIITGVDMSFNQVDLKAINWINKDSVYWIGEHYGSQVKPLLSRAGEMALRGGLNRQEAGAVFGQIFKNTFKKSEAYWEGLANHVITRSREFGNVEGYVKAEVKYLKVVAHLNSRTSEICRNMHGRIIPVSRAVKLRNKLMEAKDPEQVKKIAPWVPGESIRGVQTKDIPVGLSLPPYHFRCRTRTTMAKKSDINSKTGKPIEKIPQNSPNIPEGFEERFGAMFPKSFWDKFDRKIPFTVKQRNACYDFNSKEVFLAKRWGSWDGYDVKPGGLMDKYTVCHEYAHAFHFEANLCNLFSVDERISNTYFKCKEMLHKTKNRLYWERATRLFSQDYGVYKHLRYLTKKKFKGVYSEGEVAKLHSSTADTIMSLTKGRLGYGHSTSYFKSRFNYNYFQFISHCAESYHIGNPLMEQLFPEIYKEMINLWEELIK